MSGYTLNVPSEVYSGSGSLEQLIPLLLNKNCSSVVAIVDRGVFTNPLIQDLVNKMKESFCNVTVVTEVPPEPSRDDVLKIFNSITGVKKPDAIVAVGGGSVMDTSKIISVMLNNPEYCKDITDNSLIVNKGVTFVAVPSSAGTGAEATPNAIVLIPEKSIKFGIVHKYFLPCSVVLEPRLTVSMPSHVTAATGVDAFCHCVETFISKKSNSFTELYALKGIELISKYIRRAFDNKDDMEARENMLLAAFYGGISICTSSTVAVHALSYPLGGTYHIPHGVSNAILLAPVMEFTLPAVGKKVFAIAEAMGLEIAGKTEEKVCAEVVKAITDLVEYVKIPNKLTSFGIKNEDIDGLAKAAGEVHRLIDNNPRPLSLDDIKNIYKKLM